MRKRSVGFLLVVGGVALTTGVALSMVRTANGPLSGDPSKVENALLTPPTTTDQAASVAPESPIPSLTEADGVSDDSDGADVNTSTTRAPSEPTIGTTSGLDAVVVESRIPTSLSIGPLDVEAPIDPYGIAASGQMDVPDNVTDVGWYEFGPSPGSSGSAVLAAHVDLASQGAGVFFNLKDMAAGDLVEVGYDDGTVAEFRVVATTIYDKDELPLDAIFSRSGPPVLTLITCGGGFSRSAQSYDSNVVVYAVPVTADSPLGSATT